MSHGIDYLAVVHGPPTGRMSRSAAPMVASLFYEDLVACLDLHEVRPVPWSALEDVRQALAA